MKLRLLNAIIAGTMALFLLWFFHSPDYFISHHMIPISFAVLASFGMIKTYSAYRTGEVSRSRLCMVIVWVAVFFIISLWMASVDGRVLTHMQMMK